MPGLLLGETAAVEGDPPDTERGRELGRGGAGEFADEEEEEDEEEAEEGITVADRDTGREGEGCAASWPKVGAEDGFAVFPPPTNPGLAPVICVADWGIMCMGVR